MPRATREQREERDALILRLFLAGASYREVGRHPRVRLSHVAVGNVVRRELSADATHRDLLGESASAVYVARTEKLLASAMPKALAGDMRAWDGCRRLLEQQARFYGLLDTADDSAEVSPELPDRDADGLTQLDRYRQRHRTDGPA